MSTVPSHPEHSMNVFNCNTRSVAASQARPLYHTPEAYLDACPSATLSARTSAATDSEGMTNDPLKRYSAMADLAPALAADVAQTLARAIDARGEASLIVSGGKTPIPFFERLRAQSIEWRRVCVALADERWVEPADPGSNERMVREVLLKDRAAEARFSGLKNAP